jgi:predicted DNA-binding transcriptional regulator AlpA
LTGLRLELSDDALAGLVEAVAERVASLVLVELATPTTEPWRLLTLEEVAARLGRSTRWVRERVKRGDLPRVRLDEGAFAFELADVQAFARERRIACTPLAGVSEAGSQNGFPAARLSRSQKVRASEGNE